MGRGHPSFSELPETGEGSKEDFRQNPEGYRTPKAVMSSLRDEGLDPFDHDTKGKAEYAEGALREVQWPQRDSRERTAAQIEAEHDMIAAVLRTEYDDVTVEPFPGDINDP